MADDIDALKAALAPFRARKLHRRPGKAETNCVLNNYQAPVRAWGNRRMRSEPCLLSTGSNQIILGFSIE